MIMVARENDKSETSNRLMKRLFDSLGVAGFFNDSPLYYRKTACRLIAEIQRLFLRYYD